ncbi:MAG: SLBB domain-containing protein [Gemmatimonadaceae bacterium]
MRRALLFSLAFAVSSAHAQFANTTTATGSSPDPSSSSSGSPQFQQIAVPPVQTPMITNNPAAAGAVLPSGTLPAGVTPAQIQLYQQLQKQQGPQLLQLVPPAQQAGAIAPSQPLAAETNDFQDLIKASTGQLLPLYGYDLFRAPSTFAPVDNVPVTPEYLIGPGDELLIRAWGQIDIDYRAVVDRNGVISIPRVGTIPVAGLKYSELSEAVKKAVSKNFRNFQLLVTMGQLRSIQIFVVGQAARPGAYTVSSLSTLVNAVFAAGGPSTRGSMRSIQLKRGAQVVTELDLYDLLLRGDKSKDAPLLPGDVIYFPPSGPLAAVSGNVKNPAIYELKGPATVVQLLDYAGGLTTTAQVKQATVERIENRDRRVVDQFALDAGGMARTVKDGDLVSVYSISPKFANAVTLRGHVALPLRYAWQPGMRVSDLIPDKDALITADYFLRKNQAVRQDTVGSGQLAASVRRLYDEINWDYAVVERLNPSDLSTSLIPFNLGAIVLHGDASQNLALQPGDVVTVFSKKDVGAPAERRPVVVRLEGEFQHAGVYQATKGETLRELIIRVGGLTPQAYLFGTELTRESTKKQQEERLKTAIVQFEQDLQRAAASRARNVTSEEDAISLKAEKDAQESVLTRLKTLEPTGRIVLGLPDAPVLADFPELPLEDGDRVLIPTKPAMITVYGSVYNDAAFIHRPGKTAFDYLKQAGGTKVEADEGNMFVLRADGSVVSNDGSWWRPGKLNSVALNPGDAIVVPEDLYRTTWAKDLKDWTQIFYQFGLGVAALQVIKNY